MKTSWGWCSTLAKYCRTGVCLFFSSLGELETGHGLMILALNLRWFLSLEVRLRYCAATVTLLNNNWILFVAVFRSRRFYSRAGCWGSQTDRKANQEKICHWNSGEHNLCTTSMKIKVIVTGWSIDANLKTEHEPQLIRMQCTKT